MWQRPNAAPRPLLSSAGGGFVCIYIISGFTSQFKEKKLRKQPKNKKAIAPVKSAMALFMILLKCGD